jgi:hypothetical protein
VYFDDGEHAICAEAPVFAAEVAERLEVLNAGSGAVGPRDIHAPGRGPALSVDVENGDGSAASEGCCEMA